ncbi:MAG: DUF4112 domain-containing protein [Bacteroidales bacterium]|nr:DUF4112 domain-containing protein [Bacteroidales bacterium]
MSNSRRERTRAKFGFDSEEEKLKQERFREKYLQKKQAWEARRAVIESSNYYKILITGAVGFDVADALLGFLEIGGDLLSGVLGFAYVGLCAKVIKSVRLTLAVTCVVLVDLLLGFIPGLGSVVDVFFCANYINRYLIKGYVERDESVMRKLNIVTLICILIVAGLGYLIYRIFWQ